MHTLIVVLASASCLLFGFAAATHLGARARDLLTAKLKAEKEKALKGTKKELGSLKNEVKQLKEGATKSKEDGKAAEKLKKQLKSEKESHAKKLASLEEELTAAQLASAGGDISKLEEALGKAGRSLDEILAALVSDQQQTAALLSDTTGIAIASAGDADTIDGTAAATAMLTGIPKQLNNLVPLNKHFSFRLEDGTNSIVGHAFESDGELLALTTVGKGAPSSKAIETTLESVNSALQ